jgi:hypothetical protein
MSEGKGGWINDDRSGGRIKTVLLWSNGRSGKKTEHGTERDSYGR